MPGAGEPAVQKARDVGMGEPRQDLALAAESRRQLRGAPARTHQFHGGLLLVGAVGALGQPHFAHAAAPENALEPPRSHACAGAAGGGVQRTAAVAALVQKRALDRQALLSALGGEHGLDLRAKHFVAGAGFTNERGALLGRALQRVAEDRLDPLPCR